MKIYSSNLHIKKKKDINHDRLLWTLEIKTNLCPQK